jgi:hypothetical protein
MIGLREAPRPSALEPSVRPELDALVHRVLARSPAERPSAAELAALLRAPALAV